MIDELRERLGMVAHQAQIEWAQQQSLEVPGLQTTPLERLSDLEQEAYRQLGVAIALALVHEFGLILPAAEDSQWSEALHALAAHGKPLQMVYAQVAQDKAIAHDLLSKAAITQTEYDERVAAVEQHAARLKARMKVC